MGVIRLRKFDVLESKRIVAFVMNLWKLKFLGNFLNKCKAL